MMIRRWAIRAPIHCRAREAEYRHLGRVLGSFVVFYQTNLLLKRAPVVVVLSADPEEKKPHVHIDAGTCVCTTTSFANAKAQKQSRCPLGSNCTNKLVLYSIVSPGKKWTVHPWKDRYSVFKCKVQCKKANPKKKRQRTVNPIIDSREHTQL